MPGECLFTVCTGALLICAAVAAAQTPTPMVIVPSGAEEVTVELPKDGAPIEEKDQGEPVAVIPEGQEALLSDLLGRNVTFASGCTLSDGTIDGRSVVATYTCPAGPVVFELVHPDQAGARATMTERFALGLKSGAPPEGLANEIAARVRAGETKFEWKWLGTPGGRRTSRTTIVIVAAAALVLLGAVVWALRARRSQ